MDLFQLTPSQKTVALDLHRFRVMCCGRRFGKTLLALDQIKARASVPNSRVAYISPTYQQARDIAWEALKKDCREAAESINESRLEIRLVNSSIIFLRGWESVETLRGQLFDLIVIDEVAMMRNFWINWQEVIRPTLTDRRGEAIFISSPKGFNHFYDLYNLQETDTDFKSFHFTTYDNPYIPVDEIDKAKMQLTSDRFAQEYLADFRKTEGLVYKEFDRNIHLYLDEDEKLGKIRIEQRERMLGIDFGFTNPAAVISIVRDSSDCFYITDEFYERGKTDTQIAEIASALNPDKVFPDPAAAAGVEELRRHRLNVRDVIKGKDSIKNGIDKVRELLKAKKLKINSKCKNVISEFETYCYPDKKDAHNENEVPIDENNHALDAIRYCIMMSFYGATKVNQFRPDYTKPTFTSMARQGQNASHPNIQNRSPVTKPQNRDIINARKDMFRL